MGFPFQDAFENKTAAHPHRFVRLDGATAFLLLLLPDYDSPSDGVVTSLGFS